MASYRPSGGEKQVNSETSASLGSPDLVALASGRYLVTWYDRSGQSPTRPGIRMKGRLIEADGAPIGAEFTILDAATTKGVYAHVSSRPGGGFVLTYTDPQNNKALLARLYDESGQPAGAAVTVATAAVPTQDNVIFFVSGTSLSSNEYLISWAENGRVVQNGAGTNTMSFRAARLDAGLSKIGEPFTLVPTNPDIAPQSSVAALGGGTFAFTWSDDNEVKVRIFQAGSAAAPREFQASPANDGANSGGQLVLALTDGNLAVVYVSAGGDTMTDGLWAQVFTPAGVAVGPRVSIDQRPWGAFPAAATALTEGGFAVTWTVRNETGNGDGSGSAIKAQRFSNAGSAQGPVEVVNTSPSVIRSSRRSRRGRAVTPFPGRTLPPSTRRGPPRGERSSFGSSSQTATAARRATTC